MPVFDLEVHSDFELSVFVFEQLKSFLFPFPISSPLAMFWEPAPATDDAQPARGPLIANSHAASLLFADTDWNPGQETLLVAHLDRNRQLIAVTRHDSDQHDEILLPVRSIIADCARYDSESLILAHNHPSGDPTPSTDDLRATRGIAAVLKALDIALDDHLIFGRDGSTSLRAMGLL